MNETILTVYQERFTWRTRWEQAINRWVLTGTGDQGGTTTIPLHPSQQFPPSEAQIQAAIDYDAHITGEARRALTPT